MAQILFISTTDAGFEHFRINTDEVNLKGVNNNVKIYSITPQQESISIFILLNLKDYLDSSGLHFEDDRFNLLKKLSHKFEIENENSEYFYAIHTSDLFEVANRDTSKAEALSDERHYLWGFHHRDGDLLYDKIWGNNPNWNGILKLMREENGR